MRVSDVVDIDRYPLNSPSDPAWSRTVERARAQLAATGCALIKEFITPSGLDNMVRESEALHPHAYVSSRRFSPYPPYDAGGDQDRPDGHPRRFIADRTNRFLAYDQFADASPVRQLYEWDCFREFIRHCLGISTIHPYGDPLGACTLSFQEPGEALPWHFDQTHFIVSLLIVEPDEGGSFQYAPDLRSDADENYLAVSAILAGGSETVIELDLRPGDLQIFKGRYALHRVTAPRKPIVRAFPRHRDTAIVLPHEQPHIADDRSAAVWGSQSWRVYAGNLGRNWTGGQGTGPAAGHGRRNTDHRVPRRGPRRGSR